MLKYFELLGIVQRTLLMMTYDLIEISQQGVRNILNQNACKRSCEFFFKFLVFLVVIPEAIKSCFEFRFFLSPCALIFVYSSLLTP